MTKILFEQRDTPESEAVHFNVDINTLPAEEERKLLNLIKDADFFNLSGKRREFSEADGQLYTITVEAGQARHTIHVSRNGVNPSLGALLDALDGLLEKSSETAS